jgi:hypothetical protein
MEHKMGSISANAYKKPPLGDKKWRKETSTYTPRRENAYYYSRPLTSQEQVQGAINLSSVRYRYTPNSPCGPKIDSCHWHWERENDSIKGKVPYKQDYKKSRKQEKQEENSFCGLIFCGKPSQEPKIFLVNPEQTFNWMRHLLHPQILGERRYFTPEKLLSTDGLREKGELSVIKGCHYLAINEPRFTRKKGQESCHDRRTWIEPTAAKIQLFTCTEGRKTVDESHKAH